MGRGPDARCGSRSPPLPSAQIYPEETQSDKLVAQYSLTPGSKFFLLRQYGVVPCLFTVRVTERKCHMLWPGGLGLISPLENIHKSYRYFERNFVSVAKNLFH